MDSEIEAIGKILEALEGLTIGEQIRAINYGRWRVRDNVEAEQKLLEDAKKSLPDFDLDTKFGEK